MQRGTIRVAAVGTSLAAAILLVGCGSTHSAGRAAPPLGWITTTIRSYSLVDVTHPANWRFIHAADASQGPVGTIGYFTTEPGHSGCSTTDLPNGTTEIACRPPVSVLRPGGVLVTILASGLPVSSAYPTNSTVGGRGVEVRTNHAADCPAGATGNETLRALVPFPGASPAIAGFALEVCFNATGSKEDLAAQADTVVRGLRFR